MEIKKLEKNEINKALKLVWDVFSESEAFNYNRKGVEEFRKFLDYRDLINTFDIYGTYDKKELIGVIALQDGQHICFFFVKNSYQKRGLGRKLFEKVLKITKEKEITVSAPPCSVEVMKNLGFVPTDSEQNINGIVIIPMVYERDKKEVQILKCRDKELELGKRTLIMGILNVTPDSFSDGGEHNGLEEAIKHAQKMIDEGADIIDIGGESTRPGHTQISDDEEIARVVPVIKKVVELGAIVSVDTYKYRVAEAAFEAGAHILNDIWGLQYDNGEMAKVVKKYNVPVIAMHNQVEKEYEKDIIFSIKEFFKKTYEIAHKNGILKESVILDPGIGFGKGIDENLEVLSRLEELREEGRILLGASRKRFIGTILNDLPPQERVEGTIATTVIGIEKGVDIVRVHDVLTNKRAAMVADRIVRK
ncbi:MAG: dihydropteroate synthase [Candidatus Fusobacterium pullicola]|uniref:dihydropteroate synthase n=3 Tax=Fusobacterium TaxID=848 RepID=A0ABS2G3I5_FUSMR|nr:dihydropteroate synthase [Fusobacterium mortiferum]MBM6875153.1 dihydropteroate synthase [Fusobacterium mortiferum]MBU3841479.1 dihydropteroate synthase [Candidatus Fusobacterium pullicola]